MPSITYTALRQIEPVANGYTKTGTDISAAHADNSFNSTSTDLTGLADNEWVLVSGFANAANNGWFQANGASVLHKLTQDSSVALVTEAAGPSVTLKGYKRGLGQLYALDFNLEQADRSVSVKSASQQPMGGGAPEVILYRDEVYLQVQTGVIQETSIALWREILASIEGGETFTFDRYGTNASPIEAKTCVLSGPDYSEAREGTLYPGRYRIAFGVRVLS